MPLMPGKKPTEKKPAIEDLSKPEKKSSKETLPEDEVHLKPFLGLRPGIYLTIIYSGVLFVILFFVLLYPGISRPGSLLTVKSEPWGAAVLVDGVYRDAAPCEIFVPKGRHGIELHLPGFLPVQTEQETGGRLFASALFPLRTELKQKLQAADPAGAFVDEAAEYAAWTFAGEPSAAYQIPLSLSEGAYRLGSAAADPAVRKSMEGTIAASSRFAVTRAALRDLIRAKTLLDNNGLSPSPLSLLSSAEDVIGFLRENPQAALWLGGLLNGEAQSTLTASTWHEEAAAPGKQPMQGNFAGSIGISPQTAIQIGPLTFRMIPGGPLMGNNFPQGTTVGTFYICETPVSARAWESFLEAEPRWRKENTDALVKEGLVKEGYLETVPDAPSNVVAGISWHAARAFCEWLNASLPAQYAGLELRLPTEAEWEYAAKSSILDESSFGSFWEWCEEQFVPLSFLSLPNGAAALPSPERPLRGGSWVNQRGTVGIETRASLPPSFCPPFVSFRPVIAPKRDGL